MKITKLYARIALATTALFVAPGISAEPAEGAGSSTPPAPLADIRPKPKLPPGTKPAPKPAPKPKSPVAEAPNKAKEKKPAKRPVKDLARAIKKKLKKKHSALTAFDVTMLNDGIAHVRVTGDCGRFAVRKMHFRGHDVKIDKRLHSQKLSKEKGPRSFIIDSYIPVFKRGDVQQAKQHGLTTLKRELEVVPLCQVYKRKKWGKRKDRPRASIELELPVTEDLDPSQFKP